MFPERGLAIRWAGALGLFCVPNAAAWVAFWVWATGSNLPVTLEDEIYLTPANSQEPPHDPARARKSTLVAFVGRRLILDTIKPLPRAKLT